MNHNKRRVFLRVISVLAILSLVFHELAFSQQELVNTLSPSFASKPIINVVSDDEGNSKIEPPQENPTIMEDWVLREIGFLALEAMELGLSIRTLRDRIEENLRLRVSYQNKAKPNIRKIQEIFTLSGDFDGFSMFMGISEDEGEQVTFSFSRNAKAEKFSTATINGEKKDVYITRGTISGIEKETVKETENEPDEEKSTDSKPIEVKSWDEAVRAVKTATKKKYTELLGYPHSSHQFRGVRKEGFAAALRDGEIKTRSRNEKTWWANPVSAVGISNKLDKGMHPKGFEPGSVSIVFEIKGKTAEKYGIGSWGGGTYSPVPLKDVLRAWMVMVETEEDYQNSLVRIVEVKVPGMKESEKERESLSYGARGSFWRIDRYLEKIGKHVSFSVPEYIERMKIKDEVEERDNLRELVEKGLLYYVKGAPGEEAYGFTIAARFARIHIKGNAEIAPGSVTNPDMMAYDILEITEGSRKVSAYAMLDAMLKLMGQSEWKDVYVEALGERKKGNAWSLYDTSELNEKLSEMKPLGKRKLIDTKRIEVGRVAHDGIPAERSEEETVDLRLAAEKVNEYVMTGKEMGEEEIKEVHKILSGNLKVNDFLGKKRLVNGGEYRDRDATRSLANCPSAETIPAAMKETFILMGQKEFKDLHPVEQASLAFYIFHNLQPFENGNTRTFSLLMNNLLMSNNYPPFVITEENDEKFQKVLRFMRKPEKNKFNEGSAFLGTFIMDAPGVISSPGAISDLRKYAREFTLFLANEISSNVRRESRTEKIELSEKGYAGAFDDELKLLSAKETDKTSFIAMSTDWIKRCVAGSLQEQDINRLIISIRKRCLSRGIEFIEGDASYVESRVLRIKKDDKEARGIVIGEEFSIDAIEKTLISLGIENDKNTVLAGVRPENFEKESYLRITQILKASAALLRENFSSLPEEARKALETDMVMEHKSVGLVFIGKNRVLFDLPQAQTMEYEKLHLLYEAQIFA